MIIEFGNFDNFHLYVFLGRYYNFQRLAKWSELFYQLLGLTVFLSLIQLIHLLRFNRRMSMLSQTLNKASRDMGAFSLIFLIILISYSLLAFLMFGAVLQEYSTFITCIESQVALILGSFHFGKIRAANPAFGPVFFFTYVLIMVFALMNMFVTIINETFSAIKENLAKQSNEHELLEFIWDRFQAWSGIHVSSWLSKIGTDKERGKNTAIEYHVVLLEDITDMNQYFLLWLGHVLLKSSLNSALFIKYLISPLIEF